MESRSKQLLHWTYSCLGGVYASENVSKRKKTAFFLFNATCIFLVVIVGGCGYLLTSNNEITILDIVLGTFMPGVILFVMGVIPLITHRFHCEIKEMLDYFESCTITTGEASEYVLIRRIDSIQESLKWLRSTIVGCVVHVLIGALDILFFCKQENAIQNLHHYIFPLPYLNDIPSLYVFWIVYVIQGIIFISACAAGLPEVTFVSLIANEFHNIATVYCERMQKTTRQTTNTLDMYENWDADSSAVRSVYQMFEQDVAFFIDFHRNLIRVITLMRPYIEIFDTILLVTIFHSLLVCIYLLLLTDLDYGIKFKQVIAVLIASMYLYPHCELGTTFKTMHDAMVLQVYSLPWYYVPPTQRKLVYILLCQVQRPIEFRAFMVYSVDLVTFPRVLRAAYSYTNLLRRSINTGHNSLTS